VSTHQPLLKNFFLLVFALTSFASSAQTLAEQAFKQLPDSLFFELTESGKDSLLQFKKYIIPGGDSISTVQYSIEVDDEKHLNCFYYYTTGQRGFLTTQIKLIPKDRSSYLVILSQYGGVPTDYYNRNLNLYNFNNGVLQEIPNTILPEQIAHKQFLKSDTPDSIKTDIQTHSNECYLLDTEKEDIIEYRVGSPIIGFEWFEYEVIRFTWNGSSFSQEKIKNR